MQKNLSSYPKSEQKSLDLILKSAQQSLNLSKTYSGYPKSAPKSLDVILKSVQKSMKVSQEAILKVAKSPYI